MRGRIYLPTSGRVNAWSPEQRPCASLAFAVPIAWVFFPLMDSLGIVPAAEVMLKKELAVNAFCVEIWYLSGVF